MIHTWDQEIMRLCRIIDEVEEQNAKLGDMLTDAVRILDEAFDAVDAEKIVQSSSRRANLFRFLMSQSVSLRSQFLVRWRSLILVLNPLLLPYRRKVEPAVGWPFEPVVRRPVSVGSEDSSLNKSGVRREDEELKKK